MRDENGFLVPYKCKVVVQGKGLDETRYVYWVYKRCADVDSEPLDELAPVMHHMHRGPGTWFWALPSIRVTKRFIIVRQFGGYDV